MNKNKTNIALVMLFALGLSLLLYPTVSDYWNSFHQTRAISRYSETIAQMDTEAHDALWRSAEKYNQLLVDRPITYALSEEELAVYNAQLNIDGDGEMGYIEIPSLRVELPIYHGTSEAVLQVAVGHIEGSSLPVGGESTHCVVSGHRGLPSARLFTDLDRLVEGDVFMLQILGDTLTYQVDQILIVLPDELDALKIEQGQDLCTLVTCTPYGINSHRLLVRGHRIANADTAGTRVIADAAQLEPVVVAPILAAPMLLLLIIWVLVYYRKPVERK